MTDRLVSEHTAHFYENDRELAERVSVFLGRAFAEDHAMIAIGTPHHLSLIERNLRQAGHDIDGARRDGRYLPMDAHKALAELMAFELPTADRFNAVIGSHISVLSRRYGGVRAFGELVNLLWRDGRRQAALRLEDLWNDALGYHPLSLVCGYAVRSFTQAAEAAGIAGIINSHSRVTGPKTTTS